MAELQVVIFSLVIISILQAASAAPQSTVNANNPAAGLPTDFQGSPDIQLIIQALMQAMKSTPQQPTPTTPAPTPAAQPNQNQQLQAMLKNVLGQMVQSQSQSQSTTKSPLGPLAMLSPTSILGKQNSPDFQEALRGALMRMMQSTTTSNPLDQRQGRDMVTSSTIPPAGSDLLAAEEERRRTNIRRGFNIPLGILSSIQQSLTSTTQ